MRASVDGPKGIVSKENNSNANIWQCNSGGEQYKKRKDVQINYSSLNICQYIANQKWDITANK